MTIDSNTLDKIAALFQLAEKNNNANESATAAAMAQAMLTKYRLTKADLASHSTTEQEKPETAGKPLFESIKIPIWKKDLASTVSRVNGCRIYYSKEFVKPVDGTSRRRREYLNRIVIVGLPSDIEVVRYFFTYLVRETERLSDAALAAGEIKGKRGGNSFKIGVERAISGRLWDSLRESKAEAQSASEAGTSSAIVALENSEAAVKKFYDSINLKKATKQAARYVESNAMALGTKAGRGIVLNRGMSSGGKAGPKELKE